MRVPFRKRAFSPDLLKRPGPTSDRKSMMGGFQSITATKTCAALVGSTGRLAVTALAAALLGTVVLAVAPAAEAAESAKPAGRAPTAHARVSMSPDGHGPTDQPPQATPPAGDGLDALPLTRAAARRRVESISPVPWLAHFGPVSLERRE
jgi:hypothetical protein